MTENGNGAWEEQILPGMPQEATQGPQTWRYEVTLTCGHDPTREVDRALRVWFGDIVKEIHPC